MIQFLADENMEAWFLDRLRLEIPEIDLLTANQAGLGSTPDELILQWAADHQRLVITHDVKTFISYAEQRVALGLPMPGVVIPRPGSSISDIVASFALMVGASNPIDWENAVTHVPL